MQQPDELGVGCVKFIYDGIGDKRNGLGDTPCKAYTPETCYYRECPDCDKQARG